MPAEIREIRAAGPLINAEAIELVEGLLSRLRSGESTAVAFVEVLKGRVVATAFANDGQSYHTLNSGAARLAARFATMDDKPALDEAT
jgi:hypothetical protein